METFIPDPSKPIVWNWVQADFEIDKHEINSAIEHECELEETDLRLGFGSTAIGVLNTAVLLALSGVTFAMAPPLTLAVVGAIHGYNAGIKGRRRELESEFISDHPEVLTAIESKLNQGEPSVKVASAYEAIFRLYRRGDDAGISKVLEVSHSQSGFQATNDQGNARTQSGSLASTELQAVTGQTVAAAAPSFTSKNLTPPQNRAELIARLKQDCPLLLKLVKSHPIRAVGVQRSGKTTVVKKLCLLRMILMDGHSVTASTPHYEADNPYPEVFDVVGIRNGKRDYPAIERAWNNMASDVEACQPANVTYIWDEFGLQDKAIPITPDNDPIKEVMTSCLRETMKFGIYPIFITHGETAAFLPGSKGLVTVFLSSTVRVEAIGEMVEGEDGLETVRPTGRFNVTWLDGSKGEGVLPAWLSESFLLGMIGPRSVPKTSTPLEKLEALYQAPSVPDVEVTAIGNSDEKPDGLEDFELIELIWDYLGGKEPRTVKQITMAFRKSEKISEDDLRERLGSFDSYQGAIGSVIKFGVSKGFLVQVDDDSFTVSNKH